MYSNLGTDSKPEMGFPRFNSSVHKTHIWLAGKKKNDIFRKQYSTRPLSYIQYTVKKVSHFPVPSRDVNYQTLPAGNQ